ncbi:MAG TPA: metallophosphoesterase [Chitinophagaceae bacterium]|nr:metallophosphoesterase [Chitinophagaceae bacterium]
MNRRQFLRYSTPIALLLANGKIAAATDINPAAWNRRKTILRFAVASDGHYGQPNTPYEEYHATLVNRVNEEHALNPFAFCMVNGDIIHDDKRHYPAAKAALQKLQMPWYVSQGNHDKVTRDEWKAIWNIPVNHDFVIKKSSFLIATTSDEKGTYLPPDIDWVAAKLEEHKKQEQVFIFLHINPGKQTANAVDSPALFDVFAKYKNIRAVFNGHDHDEEGIKVKNNIPFVFDAHFGGNWGTPYRGFRVVELLKDNTLATYIMNPLEKINNAVL